MIIASNLWVLYLFNDVLDFKWYDRRPSIHESRIFIYNFIILGVYRDPPKPWTMIILKYEL